MWIACWDHLENLCKCESYLRHWGLFWNSENISQEKHLQSIRCKQMSLVLNLIVTEKQSNWDLVSGLCFSFLELQVQTTAGVTHPEPYDETTWIITALADLTKLLLFPLASCFLLRREMNVFFVHNKTFQMFKKKLSRSLNDSLKTFSGQQFGDYKTKHALSA